MNYATDSTTSTHSDPRVRTADLLLVLHAPKAINLEECTVLLVYRVEFSGLALSQNG